MAQFARPDGNVTTSGFTNDYTAIDESSASDADFAYGSNGGGNTLEVSLSNVTDPVSSSGHVVRFRLAKLNAGVLSGTGNAVTVTVGLYQGASLIASTAVAVGGSWAAGSFTLTGTEADSITDYTDLRIRVTDSSNGGSPSARRGGGISWAELEVPNLAVTGTGALSVDEAAVAASGTSLLAVTGTGAPSVDEAALAASGVVANPVTGTGAPSVDEASLAATGVEKIVGSASPSIDEGSLAAAGAEKFAGSGAVSVDEAVLAATGSLGSAGVSGTGAVSADEASLAAAGVETIGGSAAVAVDEGSVDLAGAEELTGTSSVSADEGALAASGLVRVDVTASGAVSVEPAAVDGVGFTPIKIGGDVLDINGSRRLRYPWLARGLRRNP